MSLPTRRERVVARSSGLAHQDAYPNGRKCADLLDVHRSTPPRWGRGDPSAPMNELSKYLLNTEDPWAVVAHVTAMAKWRTIQRLDTPDLIARWWDLVEAEHQIECADNLMGCQPGHSMEDRSQIKKRDSAIESELVAVLSEFAARGITQETVRGEHV